jgi:UDP-N-acetylmuramoyl-tripeptide--D-alanyl-D-alanine ligase
MNIQNLYQEVINSTGVSTDTRSIKPGMVFFALKGNNFDANNFVQQALDSGASVVVTQNEKFRKHKHCYYTANSLKTLQKLAAMHRENLNSTVIGITGTNGKTTTKELIRESLSTIDTVYSTQGNLNNHIGVPLTLLAIKKETKFAVIEMGANHMGEIEFLCKIAQPDYGIITNIGHAHLEGFGSFENVIKTKTELYRFIKRKNGKIFVNEDDSLLLEQSGKNERILYGEKILNAALINDINPFLKCRWEHNNKKYTAETHLIGNYNMPNILAAISIGLYFGGDPEKINTKLSEYIPSNMRSQWIETNSNKIILDAYNANPTSMATALKNLADIKNGKKAAILGDMLELGKYSDEEHYNILKLLIELKIDNVILIGDCFNKFKAEFNSFTFFINTAEAKNILKKHAIKNHIILLKGSRGIGVDELKELL